MRVPRHADAALLEVLALIKRVLLRIDALSDQYHCVFTLRSFTI